MEALITLIFILLLILIVEGIVITQLYSFFEFHENLKNNTTDLNFEKFKELNKQIYKNLHISNTDFKIIYAIKNKVIIKIKRNYFEFFKKDNSLAFLFSEETMLKNQINRLKEDK